MPSLHFKTIANVESPLIYLGITSQNAKAANNSVNYLYIGERIQFPRCSKTDKVRAIALETGIISYTVYVLSEMLLLWIMVMRLAFIHSRIAFSILWLR